MKYFINWDNSTPLQATFLTVLLTTLSGCTLTNMQMSAKSNTQGADNHKTYAVEKTAVQNVKSVGGKAVELGGSEHLSGIITAKQDSDPLPPVDLSRFYGGPLDKNITHYVRGIMHDLVGNLHYVNDKTPIGVTSFVFLDGEFDGSGLLGNQMAESFIHEVHQFGIPVIDFKTTDYIRVTKAGDFIFSRDYLDLKEDQPIKYVLAGTMVKHRGGLIVNARIIGLLSKAVVASAQAFIPESIIDGLLPSNTKSGVSLVQGE
jgi:TolB-like protein